MSSCLFTHFQIPTKDIESLYFYPQEQKKILVTSKQRGLLTYKLDKAEARPFEFSAKGFSAIRGVVMPKGEGAIGASLEGKIALWKNHCQTPEVVVTGHPMPINDLDIRKDTGHFITAANDKCVKLWDPSMRFISSFTGHNSQVTACTFDQKSNLVLSGDSSGTVMLWDSIEPEQGPVWSFQMRQTKRDNVLSLSFDATKSEFLILTDKGHLAVLDNRNPENVITHPFKAAPSMAAMSPPMNRQRHYVLCTAPDNSEMVFDTESNSVVFSFEAHRSPITACAWAPGGARFATADADGTIIVWNMPKPPKMPRLKTPQQSVVDVAPYAPPPSAVTAEVLAEEISILNAHMAEYNEKLADQQERINLLISDYRWRV